MEEIWRLTGNPRAIVPMGYIIGARPAIKWQQQFGCLASEKKVSETVELSLERRMAA